MPDFGREEFGGLEVPMVLAIKLRISTDSQHIIDGLDIIKPTWNFIVIANVLGASHGLNVPPHNI